MEPKKISSFAAQRTLFIVILFFLPLTAFCQFGPASDGLGKVFVVQGEVLVVRDGVEKKVSGFGMVLKMKDVVKTGATGKAKVQLSTGDEVIVAASTKLEINQDNAKKDSAIKNFFLSPFGKIRAMITKSRKQRVIIKTSNAVIGVKGTDFVVEYKMEQTTVATVDGLVNMASSVTNKDIDIPQGKMSSVSPSGEVMALKDIAGEIMSGVEISGTKMEEDEMSGEKIKL
ncbi:MAG: FecR family protein [Deltaproteobacteria bacterium]|nr:FecR family protein [Deltaproteobacteria bacterium]